MDVCVYGIMFSDDWFSEVDFPMVRPTHSEQILHRLDKFSRPCAIAFMVIGFTTSFGIYIFFILCPRHRNLMFSLEGHLNLPRQSVFFSLFPEAGSRHLLIMTAPACHGE
jgi:hypothetical protein